MRRLKILLTITALAVLSACKRAEPAAAGPVAAAPPAEPYAARGQEPGWTLEISNSGMTLTCAYGEKTATAPLPSVETIDGARRYHAATDADDIDVTIEKGPFTDSATSLPYPDKAAVMVNGEKMGGCGGDPRTLLTGGKWTIEDIDNKGVIDNAAAFIAFSKMGAVAGSGGCNRFAGRYELTPEGIALSKIISTERACFEAVMNQETAIFDILQGVTTFEIADDGALIPKDADGHSILARR